MNPKLDSGCCAGAVGAYAGAAAVKFNPENRLVGGVAALVAAGCAGGAELIPPSRSITLGAAVYAGAEAGSFRPSKSTGYGAGAYVAAGAWAPPDMKSKADCVYAGSAVVADGYESEGPPMFNRSTVAGAGFGFSTSFLGACA